MSNPTAEQRARAAFDYLNKEGIQPLDEVAWMNPEDIEAFLKPFVEAIREHAADAVQAERVAIQNRIDGACATMEVMEIDQRNIGAEAAAKILAEIARTGKHEGTFGGKEMEEAAQAILKLYNTAVERLNKLERLKWDIRE